MIYFISLLSFTTLNVAEYVQDTLQTSKELNPRESQFRFVGGAFGLYYDKTWNVKAFPFLNLNYRILSKASLFSKNNFPKILFITEIGANYILIPYFKIGPGISFYPNTYLSTHLGIATFLLPPFRSTTFAGVTGGIILNPHKKFSPEIEFGVNVTYIIIPYLGISIPIKGY